MRRWIDSGTVIVVSYIYEVICNVKGINSSFHILSHDVISPPHVTSSNNILISSPSKITSSFRLFLKSPPQITSSFRLFLKSPPHFISLKSPPHVSSFNLQSNLQLMSPLTTSTNHLIISPIPIHAYHTY